MPNQMPGNCKKIYILGATGFLGASATDYFRAKGYQLLTDRIDVTDRIGLEKQFQKTKPDTVINLVGAKASPNIDWCEDHKEETVAINVGGAINVMLAAFKVGAYPIQISSGCIYSGGSEYAFTEEDEPNFYGSFYSRMRIVLQKTLAELPVLYARIRMPISSTPYPKNIITKIAAYPKVISAPNSVTLIDDLWPALEKLFKLKITGILNLTNEGYVDHRQILRAYKKIVNPSHHYELIALEKLDGPNGITKAKRSNCVLSVEKAKNLGINMLTLTDDRIEEIMKKYKTSQ